MKRRTMMEWLLVRRSELIDPITRDYATVWACFKLIVYVLILAVAIYLIWKG